VRRYKLDLNSTMWPCHKGWEAVAKEAEHTPFQSSSGTWRCSKANLILSWYSSGSSSKPSTISVSPPHVSSKFSICLGVTQPLAKWEYVHLHTCKHGHTSGDIASSDAHWWWPAQQSAVHPWWSWRPPSCMARFDSRHGCSAMLLRLGEVSVQRW